jgi:hypothetical protein
VACAVVCHHLKLLAEPCRPVSWQGASRTAPEASQVKQDAFALAAAEQMLAACGGAAMPTDEEQKQAIITCRRMLLELASIKVNLPYTPSCLVLCYLSKLLLVQSAPLSSCASIKRQTTTVLPVTEANWETLHVCYWLYGHTL